MALTPVKTAPPNVSTVLQSNPGDRVSSGKSTIAPIVAVLSRQLPLPQAQQLAGQTALVRVVKDGPGNQVELDVAGQNILVKLPQGRTLSAGEMVTVSFAMADTGEGLGATGESGSSKKTQDSKLVGTNTFIASSDDHETESTKSPSFIDRLSGSARLIGFLERQGQGKPTRVTAAMPSLGDMVGQSNNAGEKSQAVILPGIQQALQPASQATVQSSSSTKAETSKSLVSNLPASLQLPSASKNMALQHASKIDLHTVHNNLTGELAQKVSSAVENSGLFYESHLQQWALGQRSKDQLELEPQSRFGLEQTISEKGLDPAAANQSVRYVTAQLAALDHSKVALALDGLLHKPVEIEIEPDTASPEEQNQTEDAPRPWVARLKLDMANLGELQVRVRMIGNRCDVQISSSAESKQNIDPHWREFQQAMEQQGLTLVHGQVIAQKTMNQYDNSFTVDSDHV